MSHRSLSRSPLAFVFSSYFGILWVFTGGCVHYAPQPLAPAESATALEARTLNSPALLDFIRANSVNPSTLESWDVDSLTLAAVYYNSTLAVARAQWQSAAAGRQTAAARPNPTVSLTGGYNQNAAAGVSPWFPGVSFDLPFETVGKRDARVARADATIASARQALVDTAWGVRRAVRTAWLEVHAAEAHAGVLAEQATVQSRVAELLEQRWSAGMISLPEATSARLARQRANFDAGEARRVASLARAHLAEAIGVPLAAVRSLKLVPLPESPAKLPLSTVDARALALRGRPDVLMALADFQGAEADLRQQIAKQYPDIHVVPGFQWDQGEGKWSLGATFEIPLFHRNQGPIAEALAHRGELAARVLAAQSKVLAELDAAFENYAQIETQLERARGVYAVAEDQRRASESARTAGDTDALQAESAKIESLAAELTQVDTVNAWHAAQGQIEDAVRQPLSLFSRLEVPPRSDTPTP